ncbi:LysE family translocator [Williamsia serinedens]|uniref:Threonine/homoserine/homoserine lactone efflux protein n=1 Tax=Williamsia serinedens TaxID=391736 RepID=A0ABT1H015_9NOCA|nr:LysE family translocator [Williamsia serinedens]MCP2160541.1 Threonine/homoserine/homoserine lactone efflux protein [Williamsia serinedens]
MDWAGYAMFLGFAVVLTLIPGPDTAVSIANTLAGGRARGLSAVAGIGVASLVQSVAAAAGLSVLVVRVEPLFLTIKWVGAAYLMYLAVQTFRTMRRHRSGEDVGAGATRTDDRRVRTGLRQGFLSNICNPKIIAFYLAVLPQFLGTDPSAGTVALYAVTLPAIGCSYLLAVVVGVDRARAVFSRSRVRAAMDAVTGTALVAFSLRLATE